MYSIAMSDATEQTYLDYNLIRSDLHFVLGNLKFNQKAHLDFGVKMGRVINFYGGPGAGKSVSAAQLFATLKAKKEKVELIQEVAKQWAWERRRPVSLDQFYFFGLQSRKEYSLFENVDFIITDSPVGL